MTRICVRDLHKTYHRGSTAVDVLRGIDCEFDSGQFHFIVGPSGSGKSSLLYLLGSLDEPTSGEIEIDGRSLSSWKEAERNAFRRNDVGFIFQNFNLMSNLTALDNVLVPYMPAGLTTELRQQAADLLKRVGLGDRLDHRPSHLSGGEQQRVAIARALLKKPKLVLADEPTGELDSQTGRDVMRYLRELCEEQNATVIIVTHDESHMTERDFVHRIHDGQIVESRSTLETAQVASTPGGSNSAAPSTP
ncbi:ABC transporter ATP-binding protein [Rubinisphaera sp. JC750]|uniref:ABC transporter ATP-binding protein n=1 Tax=Rubinisphaera sp. JC750 TaxID=2898658 RepID=UPI001F232C75|nr:ABC transporter ATP-binding protein [Rubinisphaera sp. JC750]